MNDSSTTQDYGEAPLEVRDTNQYQAEYIRSFVAKWDELIDWDRRMSSEGEFFIEVLRKHGARKVLDAATGTGHKPLSRFEIAGPFTEMVLLGNLAIRASEEVKWDAKELRSTNSEKANRYVRAEYRKGWKL